MQVIATYCCNLQGLSLVSFKIPDADGQLCVRLWEILSSMKLTYVRMDSLLCGSKLNIDDPLAKQLVSLFKQCTKLQALELLDVEYFYQSARTSDNRCNLLSCFPSLEYCRCKYISIEDIITTCEKLKYLYCSNSVVWSSSLSTACRNNLQQLCISSIHISFLMTTS